MAARWQRSPRQSATPCPRWPFLAHVDTSPAFSGAGVQPIVHRNYDGNPLVLPDDTTQIIDPAQFPFLHEKVGEDVVTASGTTLLGRGRQGRRRGHYGDCRRHAAAHPDIPHGPIRVCFTCDEEIGTRRPITSTRGPSVADVAYTLDGGKTGQGLTGRRSPPTWRW